MGLAAMAAEAAIPKHLKPGDETNIDTPDARKDSGPT